MYRFDSRRKARYYRSKMYHPACWHIFYLDSFYYLVHDLDIFGFVDLYGADYEEVT